MRSEGPTGGGVSPRRARLRAPPPVLLSLLIAAGAALGATADGELPLAVLVDGEPLAARLTSIDERWEIGFQAGEGTRTVNAAELVAWGKCSEPDRGPWIVLRDGSVVVADVQEFGREDLAFESRLFGGLHLPRASLAGLVWQLPADRDGRDRLLEWVLSGTNSARPGKASAEDRLRLVNGDEIGGALASLADRGLAWRGAAGTLELPLDRVLAVRLAGAGSPRDPQPTRPKPWIAWTGWRDGTRLLVAAMKTEGTAFRVTLLDGTAWSAPSGELTFLQPLGGRAVYLSDLKPEDYRHVSYLTLPWPFHADRNAAGGLLRAGGSLHLKGLGMHSASRLTYLLTEPFRRFQAEAAIDDRTASGGSVGFRVFVDGQMRYASPVIRGGQAPVPLSVDLTGARRIDLVVDFAERADELDFANWLNARLIR